MAPQTTATTTYDGEIAARDRLAGEWYQDGTTSVHLPRDVAERLLVERGWTPIGVENPRPSDTVSAGGWVSPSGEHSWHTDEALQIALVAENA